MTVFLIVSELSAVSSQDLNQSISQEAGQTGTYAIDVATTLGTSPQALASRMSDALRRYSPEPPAMIEVLPPLTLDCPPASALGSQPVLSLRGATGQLAGRPPGTPLSRRTQVCVGGQQIPSSAVRIPTPAERFEWLGAGPGSPNTGVVLASADERLALLSTSQPAGYRFVIVTDREADLSAQIEQSLNVTFRAQLLPYGMSPAQGGAGSPFGVTRLDTAQAIRSAASGVDLVYAIIAWGILILGALGLLVAEMIVVRDRTWFFGLSRAVGGRGTDIAILVLADIVLVLVAGTVVALLLAPILQPFAASFAYRAFQIPKVRFLHASTVPQLIAGEFVVLLLAGAYPALRAVRQDPLDVLEPRVS